MNLITNKQLQYLTSLMTKQQMLGYSSELALKVSNQRVFEMQSLTSLEASNLIKLLQNSDSKAVQSDTMRKKMISMAREMGWVLVKDNPTNGTPMLEANMERINNWCKQYGYLHKTLNQYTFEELPKLVSQFGILHEEFLNEL